MRSSIRAVRRRLGRPARAKRRPRRSSAPPDPRERERVKRRTPGQLDDQPEAAERQPEPEGAAQDVERVPQPQPAGDLVEPEDDDLAGRAEGGHRRRLPRRRQGRRQVGAEPEGRRERPPGDPPPRLAPRQPRRQPASAAARGRTLGRVGGLVGGGTLGPSAVPRGERYGLSAIGYWLLAIGYWLLASHGRTTGSAPSTDRVTES